MNTNLNAWRILLVLCLWPLAGWAQSYWQLTYNGTSTGTNGAGRLVTQPMTDQTLVRGCANAVGVTDTSGLALALHFNANSVGDALEVVNTNDPNLFRAEVCKLAFEESYTNAAGSVVKTFAYVYNDASVIFSDPSGHSRGSAVITRAPAGTRGATNQVITGKMQFWLGVWMDNAPATNVNICTGTFTSTGPLLNLP